jgi:hypothetical protein
MSRSSHHILAGDRLVARILPLGNGRPGNPRRFVAYWSTSVDLLAPPKIERPSAREAAAAAMSWARQHFGDLLTKRGERQ